MYFHEISERPQIHTILFNVEALSHGHSSKQEYFKGEHEDICNEYANANEYEVNTALNYAMGHLTLNNQNKKFFEFEIIEPCDILKAKILNHTLSGIVLNLK